MKKTPKLNRRGFVKVSTGVLASIPVFVTNSSSAQDLPVIAVDDPLAEALAYVEDSTTVNKERFPNHTEEQLCSSCSFYTGEADAEFGPCSIFPGKSVATSGWCSVWAIKPAES